MNAGSAATGRAPAVQRPSRRAICAAILVAFAIGCSLPCGRAADADTVIFPASARPGATSAGSVTSGLNSWSLLLAAAAAGAGGWVLWRSRRRASNALARAALAIDETRALGNRQYLVVASYEGRKFLLGVCPGRIDMLAPLASEPRSRVAE